MRLFRDRAEAGRLLAERLEPCFGGSNTVVLALPTGGLPVGLGVARRLRAPLDVLVARKLSVPGWPDKTFGAVASGGALWLDRAIIGDLGLANEDVAGLVAREERELSIRESRYLPGANFSTVAGGTVVLVDDGLATGSTMKAAVQCVRALAPVFVVVAVPVGPAEALVGLQAHADEVICLSSPVDFRTIRASYQDFSHVTEAEVLRLLHEPIHGTAALSL